MTYLLIILIVAALFSAFLLRYGDRGYDWLHTMTSFSGFLLALGCAFGAVIYAILAVSWVGAKHQANIINREYGTDYTQAEVFYASSVIDTVRELDRKRVELNGDLLSEEQP